MAKSNSIPTHPRSGRALGFVAGAVFIGVLSAAAGAGAATLITSARIKDGTIVSVDVKNGGLSGADLKDGSVGGKDVRNGSLGPADLSGAARADLMTGLIPSGTTVTGTFYYDTTANIDGDFGATVRLPGRASAPLTTDDVNFAASGGIFIAESDADPDCTGSFEAPTAPPGKVCLYLVQRTSDAFDISGSQPYGMPSDTEFAVLWTDQNSSRDVFITAVWAYTAP